MPRRSKRRSHSTLGLSLFLANKQRGRCAQCGLAIEPGDKTQIDHFVPLSRGGRDQLPNFRLTHADCNRQKSNHLPSDE
jgi:5-methylcytosine-specific restriction endonuclease McrA